MIGKYKSNYLKRIIALCLAVVTVLWILPAFPVKASATGNGSTDTDVSATATAGDAESELLIKNNITIDGIQIGGMTKEGAMTAYKSKSDALKSTNVTITSDYGDVNTTLKEIGYSDNAGEVLDEAVAYGNKGNILKRYSETKSLESASYDLSVAKSVKESSVEAVINEQLGSVLNVTSEKPRLIVNGDDISVVPASDGVFVDNEKTAEGINNILAENWDGTEITVDVVFDEDGTSEKIEQLKEIKDLLGEFTTDYSSASGRMKNIERATELLNGTVLYPGEQLSVHEAISPIESSNGYYSAGQYVGGKLVDGVGGGVCQVSTTLYNALIRAELEIVQRNNHGLTVSYVPLSADAALAGNVLDLKFKNNTDAPIYIEGFCSDGDVTFRIYGKEYRPENRTIEFESKTISVISPGPDEITEDPTLAPGTTKITQRAHTGYKAELWKYVYIDGELTESILVNRSTYKATPNYVSVGPSEETTEAPSTEAPATEAPSTEAPSTEAPTTEAPSTEAPTTEAPSTEAPSTEAPVTDPAA